METERATLDACHLVLALLEEHKWMTVRLGGVGHATDFRLAGETEFPKANAMIEADCMIFVKGAAEE